jgi:dTMP kinase
MDRYAYSGVAFSSAKGLDLEWCKAPDVGLLRPDVTLFLDIDPREAESRGGYGEERYEKSDFQLQVRERFHALKDESWVIVDARQDANQVHEAIISAIKPVLAPAAPLGLLWKK